MRHFFLGLTLSLLPESMLAGERFPSASTAVYWVAGHEVRRSDGVAFEADRFVPQGFLGEPCVYERTGSKASLLVSYFDGHEWNQKTFPIASRPIRAVLGGDATTTMLDRAQERMTVYVPQKYDVVTLPTRHQEIHAVTPNALQGKIAIAYNAFEQNHEVVRIEVVDLKAGKIVSDTAVDSSLGFFSEISWGPDDRSVIAGEMAVHWTKHLHVELSTGKILRQVDNEWLGVKAGKVIAITPE